MTALATQPPIQTAPATNGGALTAPLPKPMSRSHDDTPGASNLMDTDRFEQMVRVSVKMAYIAPKHLIGVHKEPATAWNITCANCFKIANLAFRMGVDPFALMDESYVVHGKLGFQGKLVAGAVNTRAGLVNADGSKGRLAYEYENENGKPDDLTIVVFGLFKGEPKPRTVKLSVAQGKTDNDMWRDDPRQKLIYSGVAKWARAHCPEIMLGIVTDDDIERMKAAGALTGNDDSMVQRSSLNDTLVPEDGPPPANDAGTTDASGPGPAVTGPETATTDVKKTQGGLSMTDGELSLDQLPAKLAACKTPTDAMAIEQEYKDWFGTAVPPEVAPACAKRIAEIRAAKSK